MNTIINPKSGLAPALRHGEAPAVNACLGFDDSVTETSLPLLTRCRLLSSVLLPCLHWPISFIISDQILLLSDSDVMSLLSTYSIKLGKINFAIFFLKQNIWQSARLSFHKRHWRSLTSGCIVSPLPNTQRLQQSVSFMIRLELSALSGGCTESPRRQMQILNCIEPRTWCGFFVPHFHWRSWVVRPR